MNQVLADRYQLDVEIARGAAGVVHRARDLILDESVAVKILHADAAAEPAVATAFLDEAEVLSELNHPSIVRPRDLLVEGTFMALVMDLVDGVDLRRAIMDDGPLSPRRAVWLISHVAQALAAVHAKGIVHGDVKPGNILIPADGSVPRLVDFGVARRITAPEAPTHGTPDYTAPEIIDGRPSSAKSDVYGIGLVMFEALCGVSPYRGGTIDEVLERHRTSIPVRPDGISAELWSIIENCLHLDPSMRPDAQAITPMIRAISAQLPQHAADRLSGPPPLRPRGQSAPVVAPAATGVLATPINMAAPSPSPAAVPIPAVSIPVENSDTKRRNKPMLLTGLAAGVVALAIAGVVVLNLNAGSDPASGTSPRANEESSQESTPDDSDNADPTGEDESTSPEDATPSLTDESTPDGGTGDDYDNGSDSGESEADIPGEDQIGSPFPGKPGGR
jgi:serine/threonine protein kinase